MLVINLQLEFKLSDRVGFGLAFNKGSPNTLDPDPPFNPMLRALRSNSFKLNTNELRVWFWCPDFVARFFSLFSNMMDPWKVFSIHRQYVCYRVKVLLLGMSGTILRLHSTVWRCAMESVALERTELCLKCLGQTYSRTHTYIDSRITNAHTNARAHIRWHGARTEWCRHWPMLWFFS